ncbi:MAG: hypothetical protein IPM97_08560 [Bdellovibrionaceae bacterium]|nr:hypothetical protein [Pseudobdellovibrionaceae bacterium]
MSDGKSGFEIEGALLKLKNRYDQESALQASVDGDPGKEIKRQCRRICLS